MNILFVTLTPLEYNESVTKSNYNILCGLLNLGHNVTILMPTLQHSSISYDDAYLLHNVRKVRIVNTITIGNKIRTWIKSRKIIGKIYKKLLILDSTREYLLQFNSNIVDTQLSECYDYVISTSDPKTSHLYVRKLIESGLKYGKWIQHWGDPLSGDITRKEFYPKWVIRLVERNIMKHADKIVYVSPFTKEMIAEVHPTLADKISFVPLPSDECKEQPSPIEQKMQGNLELAYLGDYTSKVRNIMPLYNACNKMNDVNLSIVGYTDLQLKSTSNIKIYPRLPQNEANAFRDRADVSISVCNLRGTQIPGKIYYDASTNKHLLVIVDGDKKDDLIVYLKKFERFIVCYNNEQSIIDAINQIRNKQSTDYITPKDLLPETVAMNILQ